MAGPQSGVVRSAVNSGVHISARNAGLPVHRNLGDRMANIVATLKILPEGIEIPTETLKDRVRRSLPSTVAIHKFEEEPIAFGLVAIIVHLVIPEDLPGGLESTEKSLRGIEGVGQIDTIMVRRV